MKKKTIYIYGTLTGVDDDWYLTGNLTKAYNYIKKENGFMTGREWYDKFKAELDNLTTDLSFKGGVFEIVHEAARRAAGCEQGVSDA